MINTKNLSQLFKFVNFECVIFESSVRHYMSITHQPFQCEYCNFKNKFSVIMKMHIQSNHKNVPSTLIIYSLFKYLLKKKTFTMLIPCMIQR